MLHLRPLYIKVRCLRSCSLELRLGLGNVGLLSNSILESSFGEL